MKNRLYLGLVVTLAIAMMRMSMPIPMKTRIAPIPNIHGHTLRLLACGGGIGLHAAGGVIGGGG